jgi:NADPH-dependent curcumin reductase CurA
VPLRSREIRLAARPRGLPAAGDLVLEEVELPDPVDGQILVRNALVSVDPYMRPRMNDVRSYVPPFEVGEPLTGGAVGQVVASASDTLPVGTWVRHDLGWREAALVDATRARAVDASVAPLSTALGVLGMPGLTAFVGIADIAEVKEGDTVFVSGAAGAVGSLAGQLARLRGARVIGSAGSAEKLAWLEELGFDAAFDYHETTPRVALRDLAPDGIDVYFDNVGGDHLEAAFGALRKRGRVAMCGAVSEYDATEPVPGPSNLFLAVANELTLRGFRGSSHAGLMDEMVREVGAWLRAGRIQYEQTVVEGLEHAPEALARLLRGQTTGKMLVRIA